MHLLVLLAGPAPSGSTGTSRRCQGCSPSPAPPGSGCPQLQPGRCDDPAAGSFHLRTVMKRLVAHGFHVPHTRDTAGVGALCAPGPAVLSRAGAFSRPAACRPSSARVLSPRHRRHLSGAVTYEASVKGSPHSPARPSPHPWPPDDTGNPPALPLGSAPARAGPAHARQGRDRLRARAWNTATSTTSCWSSNQRDSLAYVRPRVAQGS